MKALSVSDEPIADRVYDGRVRCVYKQMPVTLVTMVIVAALTSAVLFPVHSHVLLLSWFGSIVVLAAARFVLWSTYHKAPDAKPAEYWGIATSVGSAISGVLWGFGAVWLLPEQREYQLFLAFVIGGMCAGAVTVNSSHFASVVAFVLPAALALGARFLLEGSPLNLVSGAMTIIFACALSVTAYRFHSYFGEALKLQIELRDTTRQLDLANTRLQAEVAEHKSTEASLRQAQKIEAVGRLTAGIAHDFNNLLTAIIGSAELLRAKLGPHGEYARYLNTIGQASNRAALLIRQLLAFARKQTLSPRPVDLNTLVRGMAELLNITVGGKIRVQFQLAEDLWTAFVDPAQIEHAIMNLMINAGDAVDSGGTITIETTNVKFPAKGRQVTVAAGEYISISVADTGCGMPADVLGRAFDPFYTTKEPGKGSGLGLSQVYGIVQQSGGDLEIESELGLGTRVTLYLPKVNHDVPAAVWGARPLTEPASPANMFIPIDREFLAEKRHPQVHAGTQSWTLLIDDDAQVREVITAVLKESGHNVVGVDNVVSALRLIESGTPRCLIVLDFAMPEMTGDKLAKLILQRHPRTPIIFVSGQTDLSLLEGQTWVLKKPFGAKSLLETVSKALHA
jgi:signal transduction histidine kinase/CheY-like chemotaxis protein